MSSSGLSTAQTPQEALASFVWTLYDGLDFVVAISERRFAGTDMTEVRDALPGAWAAVMARRAELTNVVLAASPAALADAGLTEPMLGQELIVWRRSRTLLGQELEEAPGGEADAPAAPPPAPPPPGVTPDPPLPRKVPRWVKRFLERLSQALSYADTLLASLASVVSLAEILKETKELIEKVSGDAADELPDEPEP